jgi:hypothetical protein
MADAPSDAARALRSRRLAWLGGAGFLVAALVYALRLHFAGVEHQLLGGDELHAVRTALLTPWAGIWTYYDVSDHSTPYTLWAKFLIERHLFDELWLRVPVIVTDVLLLASPLLFRRRIGGVAALAAVALLVTSPLVVFYSIVARPYTPAALAMTLALWAFDAWLARPAAGRLVGFALACVAAVFLHLYCLFPVAALCVLALVAARRGAVSWSAAWCAGLLVAAGLAALYGPGIDGLIETRISKVGDGEPLWRTLRGSFGTLTGEVPFYAAALPVLGVIGAVALVRRERVLCVAL